MVRNLKSEAVVAHAVVAKGVDEKGLIVDSIVKDIAGMRYALSILESDNEPAIVKVLQELLKALMVERLEQAIGEHPQPYDLQANGGIEAGVRLVRGMLRTLQLPFEVAIAFHITTTHPVMTWLVGRAADLMTCLALGVDGKSAYERLLVFLLWGRLLAFGVTW